MSLPVWRPTSTARRGNESHRPPPEIGIPLRLPHTGGKDGEGLGFAREVLLPTRQVRFRTPWRADSPTKTAVVICVSGPRRTTSAIQPAMCLPTTSYAAAIA
jgi:hypothetical protein